MGLKNPLRSCSSPPHVGGKGAGGVMGGKRRELTISPPGCGYLTPEVLDILVTILGKSGADRSTCQNHMVRMYGLRIQKVSTHYLVRLWLQAWTSFLINASEFCYIFYPSLGVQEPSRQVIKRVEDHPGLAKVIPTLGTVISVSNWMVLKIGIVGELVVNCSQL